MAQFHDRSNLKDTDSSSCYLGVSSSKLEKLRVYGGGPPYVKIGRAVRYRLEDLDHWVECRLQDSTSQQQNGRTGRPLFRGIVGAGAKG